VRRLLEGNVYVAYWGMRRLGAMIIALCLCMSFNCLNCFQEKDITSVSRKSAVFHLVNQTCSDATNA
jgi:hypothetical protein